MKKILLVLSLCVAQVLSAQITDIADVRAFAASETPTDDPDINNLAWYDVTYTVTGIALNGPEFGRIRYIRDATGSLAIYDNSALDNVQRGDSITVTGPLAEFASLLEISGLDEFELVSTGNPVPEPEDITLEGFQESNECKLVRISNVSFAVQGNFEGNTNYGIYVDDINDFREVRIGNDIDVVGNPIPDGEVNIVGLMGQFQENYQLLVRDINDLEFLGPPGFSTAITTDNITNSSLTINFGTQGMGTTIVNYGLTTAFELGTVSDDNLTNTHTIDITGLEAGQIYYIEVLSTSATGETSNSDAITVATASNSTGDMKVYFNRSVNTDYATGVDAIQLSQTFDDTLKAYIAKAESTLDIAIYNFDNDLGLVDAINTAAASGITVRVVANEAVNNTAYNSLNVTQKIKSPGGQDYGLMHNKFVIIDAESSDANDPIVITGSTNWTDTQLEFDANNLIIIQDQALARTYALEFEEMINGNFSNDKANNTPKNLSIGGKKVEVYFSPTDNTDKAIEDAIETADTDLQFAILAFTRESIAYAMRDEFTNDGVFVAGIFDDISGANEDPYNILTGTIPNTIVVDSTTYQVHHKYAIIDQSNTDSDPLVITGSHNWSNNAIFDSDENFLVVHDATIANLFYQEWLERYRQAGGTQLVDGELVETALLSLENNELTVYPNPVQNELHLSWKGQDMSEDIHMQFVDLAGRVVLERKFTPLQAHDYYRIDIASLTNGTYILNLNNRSTKIIVNK